MPLAIYMLGLGIFAQGTSEFMLSGLIPTVASDLNVSIASAGALISAFAIGIVVGAPLLSVAILRMRHRPALLGFQLVFIAGHVVGALTNSYGVLLGTRVITAAAYAGFWTVATVIVLRLVPDNAKAKGLSVVVSGLSIATIVGVPAGTILAQSAGWRAAFWAVAGATALTVLALLATIPGGKTEAAGKPDLKGELRTALRPRMWVANASTMLSTASAFAIFAYLGTLLEDVSGVSAGWVPGVLALYGVGALIGLTIGGRTADAAPFETLFTSGAGIAVIAVIMAFAAHIAPLMVVLSFLLGAFAFAANPAVNARAFSLLGSARTVGGGINLAVFNVGVTVAPLASGAVIGSGAGLAGVPWVGAVFAVAMIGTGLLDRRLYRRETRGSVLVASGSAERPAPEAAATR